MKNITRILCNNNTLYYQISIRLESYPSFINGFFVKLSQIICFELTAVFFIYEKNGLLHHANNNNDTNEKIMERRIRRIQMWK